MDAKDTLCDEFCAGFGGLGPLLPFAIQSIGLVKAHLVPIRAREVSLD